MSGRKILLDSNAIIYASKGEIDLDSLIEKYDDFYISVITYIEVLGYDFKSEKEFTNVKRIIELFKIVNVDLILAETIISVRKKRKIKLPDAIIIATAKLLEADLLTENVKDFSNIFKTVNLIKPVNL